MKSDVMITPSFSMGNPRDLPSLRLWLNVYCIVSGAYVAQYKFTVLLMPNGPHKITGSSYSGYFILPQKQNKQSVKPCFLRPAIR